jgi:hypothetical protein
MSSEVQGALPLPDFDRLPVEALAARVPSLDIQQVEQLIGYERNHSERVEVLDLLERQREQLQRKHTT